MSIDRRLLLSIVSIIVVIGLAFAAFLFSRGVVAPGESESQAQDVDSVTEETEKEEAVEQSHVDILNYIYTPETITVKVGTTVTWTNRDSMAHTVTTYGDAPEVIDSGLFGKGESFSFTFDTPGIYDYLCEPHPYMKGRVVVTE